MSQYQNGKRGGKVRVRAKINDVDKKTLSITELPFSVTTVQLIDSIIKANDKGKIKIRKVIDNTAKNVEILIELASGISPNVTRDALYAFTSCEISISPNACIIIEEKPHFITVNDILRISTKNTVELLRFELEIRQGELEEKWHMASLERIFIENRVYYEIEECETWESVLSTIASEMYKYIVTPSQESAPNDLRIRLHRDLNQDDILKLTEIKIKRISKFNKFKADELIQGIELELEEVAHNLANLTKYAIDYYLRILEKYSKGRARKTEITNFEDIQAVNVVAKNIKLYANLREGFIGHSLKKDIFIADCSDIDDVIVIRDDGKMLISKISDKSFVGKKIRYVDVWKKSDERTTYNLIYVDGLTGKSMAKRFHVNRITRDKEYDLTAGSKGSKLLYLTVNPNGESEVVTIKLSSTSAARKKVFDFDFGSLGIKGRTSKGNTLTKYPIRQILQKEIGKSTLGAMNIWVDGVSGRLNQDERGIFVGAFDTGDLILAIYRDGSYELVELDLSNKFDVKNIEIIKKFKDSLIISAVHFDGEKEWTLVKRFQIETSKVGQRFKFISEHKSSKLYFVTLSPAPLIKYVTTKGEEGQEQLDEFIDLKGWKAMGNRLGEGKLRKIDEVIVSTNGLDTEVPEKLAPGDSLDLDVKQQGTLFDLGE